MPRLTLVVRRGALDTARLVLAAFPFVRVIFDRRWTGRRRRIEPRISERRVADRRQTASPLTALDILGVISEGRVMYRAALRRPRLCRGGTDHLGGTARAQRLSNV